ncbi:MAG: sulfatase-like hydrolase/transferase [Bacteroidetes bacterium]|nr:sulfatase-like hydrolase/transferase [Bacteroidota bacterium]
MKKWWYLPAIAFFTLIVTAICRILFFYVNNHEWVEAPPAQALLIGVRFDLSVICYWLAPVLLLQFFLHSAKKSMPKWTRILQRTYLLLGFLGISFISVADIAYYKFYYTHLNLSVFNWSENPVEMLGIIIGDSLFIWCLAGILGIFLLFFFLHRFMYRFAELEKSTSGKIWMYAILSCFFFIGMRGGLRAKPLNIKDSWYSEHYFFNQLALSPIYNFYEQTVLENILEKPLDEQEAEAFLQERKKNTNLHSFVFGIPKLKPRCNVVFILMEGFASHKLQRTSFLDSLTREGIYFDSFYSTGEHTYNGVYSSLYGEGAIMGKHMLRWMEGAEVKGLPFVMKQNGYRTIFQIPHARTFDNMSKFLYRHYFDSVTDVSSMVPAFRSNSIWGTSDHLYLKFAIKTMDSLMKKQIPVFQTCLTVSDHSPYFFPADFPYNKSLSKTQNGELYADWSLKKYFESASKKEWFNNTLFVLVADHGQHSGKQDYALPLSLHHIPFLIYAPGLGIHAQIIHKTGNQSDIYPTLCHLLGIEIPEDVFGFNLFTESRPYVILSSDAYYGILNQENYSRVDSYGNYFEDKKSNGTKTDYKKTLMLHARYMQHRAEQLRK